jgi:geranylgeranyl diphosphate synthase type II
VDVRAYLSERAVWVDRYLEAQLPPAGAEPAPLHAAMRHLVFPGGKRVRPAFAFAACEAVGCPPERVLPLAAALELVHTYSLVHDDLPCMDDDALRRGRPTVHAVYGEALAVLAGDALLARAFEVLARGSAAAGAGAEACLEVLAELALAAGSAALVGGQAADLAFSADGADAAAIERVHERKTAALFAAASGGAARLAGASAALGDRLRRFGLAAGIAFQIADDVEDGAGDEACSLARVLGERGARARADFYLDRALREIDDLGERAAPLRELARFAAARET